MAFLENKAGAGRARVGILGAGQIVAEAHLPVLKALPGVDLDWIVDVDHKRASNVAASFGCRAVRAPARPEDLPPADVVLVAIPYGARRPYIESLAARGTALYVEKPFAQTLSEHDGYVALTPPERIACGFQRRMSPAAGVVRSLIEKGLLGPLGSIRLEFGRPGLVTGGRYSGNLAMAGGGVLFEVGVHPLDFALHVVDATDVGVDRIEMQRHGGFDIHTDAALKVHLRNGSSIKLELVVTNLQFTSMAVRFDFANANASVDLFGDNRVKVRRANEREFLTLSGDHGEDARSSAQLFALFWHQFLDGLLTATPNSTSASTSRVTTSAVEQLYRAGAQ